MLQKASAFGSMLSVNADESFEIVSQFGYPSIDSAGVKKTTCPSSTEATYIALAKSCHW